MKLKKIASLALAGVMAVSMLAGCKGNDSSNSTPTTDDSVSVTDVVKALNDGQAASNKVKITFTDNAKLDSALQRVLNEYGSDLDATDVTNAVTDLAGIVAKPATYGGAFIVSSGATKGLLNSATNYYHENGTKNNAGKTFTAVNVVSFAASNETAALKAMANTVNGVIAGLPERSTLTKGTTDANGVDVTSGADKLEKGDKYFTFSYTGDAAMLTVAQPGGTATYYLVYTINQTVTEATLGE